MSDTENPKPKKSYPKHRKSPTPTPKDLYARERDAKAVEMRLDGATYEEIAQALSYRDEEYARRRVRVELERFASQSVDEYRQKFTGELEMILLGIKRKAFNGDTVAIKTYLLAYDRLSRLHGLEKSKEPTDKPTPLNQLFQIQIGNSRVKDQVIDLTPPAIEPIQEIDET